MIRLDGNRRRMAQNSEVRGQSGLAGTCPDGLAPAPGVDQRDILRSSIEQMVAAAYRLDEQLLRLPTRGRKHVALARQTAMYLAHTVCEMTLTETGQLFERDRTTVAHACAVIEDRREDPAFDRAIDMLERSARIIQFHASSLPTRL